MSNGDPPAAQYRLLAPHFLSGGIYYDANTVITAGVQVPANWVPSLNVDALNAAAASAMYSAGPRQNCYENRNQYQQENYWNIGYSPFLVAQTYWQYLPSQNMWEFVSPYGSFAPVGAS